jgi:acetolactate synthase I/II/III large subunit
MRLSDYVLDHLAQYVRHVFLVTGGGAMYLNDSLARSRVGAVPMLHEQAASIAAESYARLNGFGVVMVTSGPGGTNALTGVAGAWLESTPMLILSGQVKRADLRSGILPPRQYGLQELDIISMVKPITKYAVSVREPDRIRYHLEKAIHKAMHGRKGPVWLEIPLDVQSAEIDPAKQIAYEAPEIDEPTLRDEVMQTIQLLNEAARPVLLLGNGARAGNTREFAELLDIPVLSTWNAADILTHEHYLYFGSPGVVASRSANFILQNADLLICIGARLDFAMTGFDKAGFAPNAKKIIVDIDIAELGKIHTDVAVCADAETFMRKVILNKAFIQKTVFKTWEWMNYCIEMNSKYPISYDWVESLDIRSEDIIIPGSSGLTLDELWLSIRLKEGQRMYATMGLGAMGFAIPAAIGAALASGRRVVCVDGDGSFQLNIQELDTVRRLSLPIKFYYLNNGGYRSIRMTQDSYFNGRRMGSEFVFPDINKVAELYGVDITEIVLPDAPLPPRYKATLNADGTQTVGRLENLYPYLPEEELERNMFNARLPSL